MPHIQPHPLADKGQMSVQLERFYSCVHIYLIDSVQPVRRIGIQSAVRALHPSKPQSVIFFQLSCAKEELALHDTTSAMKTENVVRPVDSVAPGHNVSAANGNLLKSMYHLFIYIFSREAQL